MKMIQIIGSGSPIQFYTGIGFFEVPISLVIVMVWKVVSLHNGFNYSICISNFIDII